MNEINVISGVVGEKVIKFNKVYFNIGKKKFVKAVNPEEEIPDIENGYNLEVRYVEIPKSFKNSDDKLINYKENNVQEFTLLEKGNKPTNTKDDMIVRSVAIKAASTLVNGTATTAETTIVIAKIFEKYIKGE